MTIETAGVRNVAVHYGPRSTEGKYGRAGVGNELVKTAQWTFDYDDLPDAGATNLELSLPANASIVSAKLEILTGFTSTSTTTDLTIGLQQSDGTEIDNDGLVAAAEATQTAIATAGNIITGAGALVGATIGSAAGELTVAPTVDDLLTGKGRVIVEYILQKEGY